MINFPSDLLGEWFDLDQESLSLSKNHKFLNRNNMLKRSWRNLVHVIPNYLDKISPGSKSFLDMSSGNGAACELMRYLGYNIMACDWYNCREYYSTYRPFLDSQNIPLVEHDCRNLPYPFADKSYHIITCVGAIGCYTEDVSKFSEILDEFARIAIDTIGISVNRGWKLDEGKDYISQWIHPDFNLTYSNQHLFRWEKK